MSQPSDGVVRTNNFQRIWIPRLIGAVCVVAISVIGLGMTDFARRDAQVYWALVVPILIALSVRIFGRSRNQERWWPAIRDQALHWLGFLIAVQIMFMLIRSGTLSENAGGLVSLLLLALTAYTAGIHVDRSFLLVAALLALTVLLATYVEEYMWIVLVILGLVVAALLLTRWPRGARS